jgi:hypothetical protein
MYQFTPVWSVNTSMLYGHYIFGHYQTFRIGISRMILNRLVTLSYDTDVHRFNFDFGSGQL